MFCCTLLYVPSSFAIILMGKGELVPLLSFLSWCLVIVVWLFLAVPWVCLQFVIVVFPNHTHLLFSRSKYFTALYMACNANIFRFWITDCFWCVDDNNGFGLLV